MTRQTFLQGALILIIAGMTTRFLGFVNRLVIARLMGEEGVGLYMMALPTLFLVLTLTQLGLPVAISKRVAEATAKKDEKKVKTILTVSFAIIILSSLFFTLLMIVGAPAIAKYLFTDERTLYPLIAISPVVPIIALSSVLKGYFQGKHNMRPQSYALMIEQVVRIAFVALFIKIFLPLGIEYAAAGAMLSVVVGEIASLLFILYMFQKNKTIKLRYRFFTYLKSGKDAVKQLFSIALPSTGSRIMSSLSYFLEPILIAQSLAIAGISSTLATKQYGELAGYAMPLLFLPTFITNSLSIALVPSISEADAKNDQNLVHYRIHQSIRISFASGAIATIILVLFASPILQIMYGTDSASRFLLLMAPFYLLLYVQAPLQSTLQALDLAKPAMWNSLIGTIVKLATLVALTTQPMFGIMGAAIAMSVSVVLITFLHLASLKKTIQFQLSKVDLSKMILLLFVTWLIGRQIKKIAIETNYYLPTFISLILLLVIFYSFMLILFKFITKDELKQIPFLQRWVM